MNEDQIVRTFEFVGIPRSQTTIYLDLIKHKDSTATQISRRTKMHRSNVYDTLTKLKERNLVYFATKEGKQIFVAMAPDLILHDQMQNLSGLKEVLTYVKGIFAPTETPNVYILEGLNSVKSNLLSMLNKKDTIWVYGLIENETLINILDDELMHSFHVERIKKNIELKMLFYNSSPEKLAQLGKIKFTEARFLPKVNQTKNSQITQIVCGNSVYITLWIHPIYTIVIDSEIIAKEYVDFYTLLWENSKKI